MHNTDIYYQIPILPTDALQRLEQHYRYYIENYDPPKRFNYRWHIWLRIHFEIEKREKEKSKNVV